MPSLASLVDTGPVVLEKKILNFVNALLLFCYFLALEKGMAL